MDKDTSKKIKIFHRICLSLAKFFWKIAIKGMRKNNNKPVGIPWQRDPENPCKFYEPFKRSPNSWHDCETDGHYLCKQCFHNIDNPIHL